MRSISIGDCAFIGRDCRILASEFSVGDYGKIHNHVVVLGPGSCKIGHNCWVGEYTMFNCHDCLTIGNNVQIGTGNHIWTHVASGELLEGSTLFATRPVTIEDNVWLVGNGITISPGVTLSEGTVILPNSIITKTTKPHSCYAGNPAVDITEKVNPWRQVSLDEKYEMMKKFAGEFITAQGGTGSPENDFICSLGRIKFIESLEPAESDEIDRTSKGGTVVITKSEIGKLRACNVTFFSLASKKYTKHLFPLERSLMNFLVGVRARFIPLSEGSAT